MLVRIKINNFLLIESLELDFFQGLTAITGETGSGKSIVIDALMIVFGQKVGVDVIRINASFALFESEFELTNQEVLHWLEENDLLDVDNPNNLICRRIIYANGKNKVYINGNTVTISQVKQIGGLILDIHTQHASVSILSSEVQRKLLDEYANNNQLVEHLGQVYKDIKSIKNQIESSHNQFIHNKQIEEELKNKYNDLKSLQLNSNTWIELNNKQSQLANSNYILEELNCISNYLFNGDNSLKRIISKLILRIEKLNRVYSKASDLNTFLNSIEVELEELEHQINLLFNDIEIEPEALCLVEEKIDNIFTISRKYRIAPESIIDVIAEVENQLVKLNHNLDIKYLEEELNELNHKYFILSNQISLNRNNAAALLANSVTELLHKLAINGEFKIDLIKSDCLSTGVETIDFKIAFNKGIEAKSLSKVASGGELSRTALALYLLLSIHNPPEVIIFDEIDVGIGGKVAAIVGKLLQDLGKNKQVICITHQPQTASYCNNHLVVSKQDESQYTYSDIKYVEGDEKVAEISRMLSGLEITTATIVHAKELLQKTD
jgi:DNA repair protein RecN (Recombination protein N)